MNGGNNTYGLSLEQQAAIMAQLEVEFNTFSSQFYPLLPKRVRIGMLLDNMSEVIDVVADFFPINSIVNDKTRTKIQGLLSPPEEFTDIFDPPGHNNYQIDPFWDSLRGNNGGAIYTLTKLNASVAAMELGVLMFNVNWSTLDAVAGLISTVLKPSLNILTETYEDMSTFIADPNKSVPAATTKQALWIGELYSAKGLLMGVTSDVEGEFDAFANAAAQAQCELYWENLAEFIENESSVQEQHELARRVADDRLGNLDQALTGITPNSVGKMLAGAQSTRIQLLAGSGSDAGLASRCKVFCDSVEALEGFDDMKEFFDDLFSNLEDTQLGSQIVGALRNGNLEALLSQLGPYEDIASWLLSCIAIEDPDVGELDKIIKEKMKAIQRTIVDALSTALNTPSLPEFEAWQRWKDKQIKNLQDSWESLNSMLEMLEDPKKLLQFTLYNIEPDDPCSITSILEAIGELIEKFFNELQETFEEIVESAGGNIIAILIIVLAEYVAAELNNLIQQYGLDVMFGNALKALLNAIATIMVALNGAKLYMQYLAAKALRSEALLRLELTQHLSTEMTYLVQVLQMMKTIDLGDNDSFMEIMEAMAYVRKAKLNVGIELGKTMNGRQPSMRSLSTAETHIQRAIDALAPAAETDGLVDIHTINQLLEDWNVDATVYEYTDSELKLLAQAIRKRFFTLPPIELVPQYLEGFIQGNEVDLGYLDPGAYDAFYDTWTMPETQPEPDEGEGENIGG